MFVALGTLAPGIPLGIHVLMRDRGAAILGRLREWMIRENATIVAVLCLVIGAKLIGDAVGTLGRLSYRSPGQRRFSAGTTTPAAPRSTLTVKSSQSNESRQIVILPSRTSKRPQTQKRCSKRPTLIASARSVSTTSPSAATL